jgi:hypothetical protein
MSYSLISNIVTRLEPTTPKYIFQNKEKLRFRLFHHKMLGFLFIYLFFKYAFSFFFFFFFLVLTNNCNYISLI